MTSISYLLPLEINPQIFFTRSLHQVLKCPKNRPYSWSVRSSVSPGRTGTEMSSFFLLFLHNLSRTRKKVGIQPSCLVSEYGTYGETRLCARWPQHSVLPRGRIFDYGIFLDEDTDVHDHFPPSLLINYFFTFMVL